MHGCRRWRSRLQFESTRFFGPSLDRAGRPRRFYRSRPCRDVRFRGRDERHSERGLTRRAVPILPAHFPKRGIGLEMPLGRPGRRQPDVVNDRECARTVPRERARERRQSDRRRVRRREVRDNAQPAAGECRLTNADVVERGVIHLPPHVVLRFVTLADTAESHRVVITRGRHPCIAGVSRQILTVRPDDEAAGVGMRVPAVEPPLGEL